MSKKREEPILSLVLNWALLNKFKDFMIKHEIFNKSEAARILIEKGLEADGNTQIRKETK